jgi:hypothetical protein
MDVLDDEVEAPRSPTTDRERAESIVQKNAPRGLLTWPEAAALVERGIQVGRTLRRGGIHIRERKS